jgi:hypothetical protein
MILSDPSQAGGLGDDGPPLGRRRRAGDEAAASDHGPVSRVPDGGVPTGVLDPGVVSPEEWLAVA